MMSCGPALRPENSLSVVNAHHMVAVALSHFADGVHTQKGDAAVLDAKVEKLIADGYYTRKAIKGKKVPLG
jgi:hypothetical protein